ncbi:RDD family protein [Oceanidesulfovibrio indonesiensis]|nr:RDD family protein [Oceanidesulfovibrio indonesiensis]
MSKTERMAAAEEFEFEDDTGTGEALPTAIGWPRILARGVDMFFMYILFTVGVFAVFGFVLGLLGRLDLLQEYLGQHWLVQAVAPLLIWGLAESLFMPMTGATPGKLLLGLRVVKDDADSCPGFGRSFLRTYWMLLRGLLLGVPVLSYFAMFYWTSALMPPYKAPPWDRRSRTRVVMERQPGKFAMAVAVFLMFVGIAWTVHMFLARSFG